AATRSSGPLEGSSPLDSSATRGRETPIAVSMNAAPMCANWTRCSGRTSTLAPASSRRNGEPGTGTSTASAGRWMPLPRLIRKREAALGDGGGSPARDLSGAVVGPVRVDRDGDRIGHRPGGLVIVVVVVRVVH